MKHGAEERIKHEAEEGIKHGAEEEIKCGADEGIKHRCTVACDMMQPYETDAMKVDHEFWSYLPACATEQLAVQPIANMAIKVKNKFSKKNKDNKSLFILSRF